MTRGLWGRLGRRLARRTIRGHIDGLLDGRLNGWAIDPRAPETAVVLRIEAGDAVVRVMADQYRADIVSAGLGSGKCGFQLPLSRLPAGVSCRIFADASNIELDGSPVVLPAADTLAPLQRPEPAGEPPPQTDLNHVQLKFGYAAMVRDRPPTALAVPSMMSHDERCFLYGLARQHYRGEGIIVDAGIFLGASTRCFADGLRANPHLAKARALKQTPIVSFEKGTTNPGMIPFFKRHGVKITVDLNDSFLPVVHDYLKPAMDLVDLRVGDITQTAENLDYPIEICFLDVLKLPDISSYCLGKFFPRLIPGRSIVIQQDYFYDLLPYIKTHQEFLRDHFMFLGEVNSTAAFLCTSPVPMEKLAALRAGIPYDEQLRLAGIAMQRSAVPARRFMMALSKVRVIRKGAGLAAARAYFEMLKTDFPEQVAEASNERLMDAYQAVVKLLA